MADYGLLTTGFVRKRYPEILAEILSDLKTATGLDFDADPESVTGQFIKVFAEREAAQWELAQAVYNAMYPPSAVGQALDDAVSFVGIRRIPAKRTLVPAVLYGDLYTVVPANSIVRSQLASGNYLLDSAVTIWNGNAAIVETQLAVVNSSVYVTNINGVSYNYTSDSSATLAEIQAGIIAAVSASPGVVAEAISGGVRIRSVSLASFILIVSSQYTYTLIGSPGLFYREDVGPEAPLVGSLNNIVTTVSGWLSVNNILEASPGRLEETDAELRSRYNFGVFRTGAGTVESIKANLFEKVPGISYAKVYQNKTNSTDADSRPAHSVEAVVSGGLASDIFALLFSQVAGGIETYGNTTGTVIDSQGIAQTVKFTRPTPVLGWLKMTVTKYTEEALPDNSAAALIAAAVATGNSFGVGTDIIVQRFLGPLFAAIPGIATITITVATGAAPSSGDYVSTNIPISLRDYTVWDASRISVTIVP